MTFDLHHRDLGRVGFTPKAVAYTQDPHRLHDYQKQVRRWTLGFWQTVRRHGVWVGRFWLALALMIAEVVSCAVALLVAAAALTAMLAGTLAEAVVGDAGALGALDAPVTLAQGHVGYLTLLLGIALPDYLLTVFTACWQRRPSYLLFGLFFLPLRLLDSVAAMRSLVGAFRVQSSGRWVSPTRQVSPSVPVGSPLGKPLAELTSGR